MNLFQQAKTKFNLVDTVAKYVDLKPSGGDFIGLCPFHKEKTPSFRVYTKSVSYFCHGCHAWGDVTDFLTRIGRPELLETLNTDSLSIQNLVRRIQSVRFERSLPPRFVLQTIDSIFDNTGHLMIDLTWRHRKLLDEDLIFLLKRYHQHFMVDQFFEILPGNFITFLHFKPVLSFLWNSRDELLQDLHLISYEISKGIAISLELQYQRVINLYQDFLRLFYDLFPHEFENSPKALYH